MCADAAGQEFAARLANQIPLKAQIADDRAAHGTPAEARDAEKLREEQPADDDAQVVDDGAERLTGEIVAGSERAHHETTQKEADLRGQQNASQCHRIVDLAGYLGEARIGQHHEGMRKDLAQDDEAHHHEGHDRSDHAENPPRLALFSLRDILGEYRDKGAGERASRDQEEEQIGDGERAVVDVGLITLSELMCDHTLADKTQYAAARDAKHHNAGCSGDAPL